MKDLKERCFIHFPHYFFTFGKNKNIIIFFTSTENNILKISFFLLESSKLQNDQFHSYINET